MTTYKSTKSALAAATHIRESKMKCKPFDIHVSEYAELCVDSGGFCVCCREQVYGVEPDASQYECDSCGAAAVYGVENLLLMGLLELEGE